MTDHRIFRAELTGLEPDTEYVFRIGTDSAEQRFRTMPAKDTNTIQFVSGGDCGVGAHAAAVPTSWRLPKRRLRDSWAAIFAYENGRDPDRFLEFLKNYSSDLRDDQQRLIPLVALHRQSRSRWRIRAAADEGAVFLLGVRRLVSRNGLRGFGFWPIHVAGVARHEPHVAGRRRADRLAGAHAERAAGLPERVRGQSRAGVSVASSL